MNKKYSIIIISTLREKLKTTPIDKISVANICRDAKISRQSFYYHFTSISDCLYQMFLDDFNELRKKIPDFKQINTFREVFIHFYYYVYENKECIKNILTSNQKYTLFNYFWNALNAYIKRYLPKAIPESQLLPAEDLKYIIEFYTSCFITSIVNWVGKDFSTTPDFEAVHFQIISEGSMKVWLNKFIAFNRRKALTHKA